MLDKKSHYTLELALDAQHYLCPGYLPKYPERALDSITPFWMALSNRVVTEAAP